MKNQFKIELSLDARGFYVSSLLGGNSKGNLERNHIFTCANSGKLIPSVFIELSCPLHWNFQDYAPKFSLGSWYCSHCEHPSVCGDVPKNEIHHDDSIKKK